MRAHLHGLTLPLVCGIVGLRPLARRHLRQDNRQRALIASAEKRGRVLLHHLLLLSEGGRLLLQPRRVGHRQAIEVLRAEVVADATAAAAAAAAAPAAAAAAPAAPAPIRYVQRRFLGEALASPSPRLGPVGGASHASLDGLAFVLKHGINPLWGGRAH